ncbi:DDE-type integrase/transposase/recombinase [Enterococcus faecium]|nr:DDE-type integrase/transposase/recombinase [Enterococcus faecium]MCZ1345794.1 DDE-type integrase/transposase/recombinase [Enterococcus faecium]MCZ1944146.1 DDE-type integrase/transposase/recombinase [Enterococcus faecium]MCZ2039632.1 DDE-type integrase/transposase/recombinase [Enterococcus faecium]MCZ2225206.1 DDE-type integrase/transposase/recombinase [Enterococcus faecium]
MANHLDRKFTQTKALSAVVTDLTYVRVGTNWAYICLMIDLFNREIIGHSCGNKKDAQLVKRAIQSIPYSLQEIELFHGLYEKA